MIVCQCEQLILTGIAVSLVVVIYLFNLKNYLTCIIHQKEAQSNVINVNLLIKKIGYCNWLIKFTYM